MLWHGVVLRLEPWALATPHWPADTVAALAPTVGEGLYDQVERDLECWLGRPLSVGEEADEKLATRLVAIGLGGARAVPRVVKDGRAYSPIEHWKGDPTAPRVEAGWEATELVTGRSPQVRLRPVGGGPDRVVAGDAMVVAAGTLESTRLVLQVAGQPGTAPTGLNDHLVQGFLALIPPDAVGLESAVDAFAFVPGLDAARSNMFVRVRPWQRDPGLVMLDVWEMGEQLPESQTRLSVTASAPPWSVRIEPDLSEADRSVLGGQVVRLRQVWKALGVGAGTPILPDLLSEPIDFKDARERLMQRGEPQTYAWPLGMVQHEGGSLPLGGEFVDTHGRLRSMSGVHVVGPSVFPRPGAANPSLTTLSLAERTAALITGS